MKHFGFLLHLKLFYLTLILGFFFSFLGGVFLCFINIY